MTSQDLWYNSTTSSAAWDNTEKEQNCTSLLLGNDKFTFDSDEENRLFPFNENWHSSFHTNQQVQFAMFLKKGINLFEFCVWYLFIWDEFCVRSETETMRNVNMSLVWNIKRHIISHQQKITNVNTQDCRRDDYKKRRRKQITRRIYQWKLFTMARRIQCNRSTSSISRLCDSAKYHTKD